ncbi:MAG TPA: rod shape-determining protein MreC [Anaerolineales bacterium]|nr:rod shape-determining protein MreC [Anaerolineae bacterium]HIP86860.1 rod shape-determining protein MreC [Anaerolineales bacterium]
MKRTTWRSWVPPFLFLLTILFLILHEAGILTPIESGLQYVTGPLQRGATRAIEQAGNLFRTVREVRELQAQVEELQQQVEALSIENVRLQEFQAEVVQLRSLLNFVAENPSWTYLGADVVGRAACAYAPCGEVIGDEPNPYLRYLSVNVGSQEGVDVGMPVLTGGGVLIGRAAEVGPHTTKVQLLTDTGSAVAAMLQQSRATGLVVGRPDGTLRMLYIPQEEEVQVGDVVLTSGLAGTLPRGLVVGQVVSVEQKDIALFQEAVIRPAVDYREVELVLVITSFQPLIQEESPAGEQP